MKYLLIFILYLISIETKLHAKWFCNEAASEKTGNVISTCGIGESSDESGARKKAGINAMDEFNLICDKSDDCKDFEYNIEPLRNECLKENDKYKCYRGFQFTINPNKKRNTINDNELKELREKVSKAKEEEQKVKEFEKLKYQLDTKNFEKSTTYRWWGYSSLGLLTTSVVTFSVGIGYHISSNNDYDKLTNLSNNQIEEMKSLINSIESKENIRNGLLYTSLGTLCGSIITGIVYWVYDVDYRSVGLVLNKNNIMLSYRLEF